MNIETIQETDGTWSAITLNLPGGGGCGETESEAIDDAKQSVVGLIESYEEEGVDVPFVSY